MRYNLYNNHTGIIPHTQIKFQWGKETKSIPIDSFPEPEADDFTRVTQTKYEHSIEEIIQDARERAGNPLKRKPTPPGYKELTY